MISYFMKKLYFPITIYCLLVPEKGAFGHFSRICLGAINEQKDMLEDQKAQKT